MSIDIIDFENLVHTVRLTKGSVPGLESLGRLAFLPGDTTLMMMPGRDPSGGPFQILDLRSYRITQSSLIPLSPSFTGGVVVGVR